MFALIFFTTSISASAAPMPMTSSSAFFQLNKEMYKSALGYSLHAAETGWVLSNEKKNNPYIETVYRSQALNAVAALTVRADKAGRSKTIEGYMGRWLKDYPRFGFKILTSKKVRVGDQVGYLLDLVNASTDRQLRQIVFLKGKNVVTLTCRDERANFASSLKYCNEIIRTFRW